MGKTCSGSGSGSSNNLFLLGESSGTSPSGGGVKCSRLDGDKKRCKREEECEWNGKKETCSARKSGGGGGPSAPSASSSFSSGGCSAIAKKKKCKRERDCEWRSNKCRSSSGGSSGGGSSDSPDYNDDLW